MPLAPPVLRRNWAPTEPPAQGNALLPPGANAFDLLRINAQAPAMSRKSPDSFLQAVFEWRTHNLDAFINVGNAHWLKSLRLAYAKRIFVVNMVRRAVLDLPGEAAFLMTKAEKEDWVGARYDYLRAANQETMLQYIAHICQVDQSIPRRLSKQRHDEEANDDTV
jgi:hypothetical protein